MNNQWLTIKQLDRQFKAWRSAHDLYAVPRLGWVKTVRVALSMSAEQLAKRLGVTRARISQLEQAEIHDAVTLRTLREAAEAMNCELIYAIIPKKSLTLESIIKTRAQQVAEERVARTAHSMSLEAQTVNKKQLEEQSKELASHLAQTFNKKIWAEIPQDLLHEILRVTKKRK